MAEHLDKPKGEQMSPAEFQSAREFLGLSQDWLARHLGVTLRTVQHWEAGRHPVPPGVRREMEALEAQTSARVREIAQKLKNSTAPTVTLYRTDADYATADPDARFPARWLRMVAMRVALEVPVLSIVYADQVTTEAANAAHH
jgi:DNA-binding XRE family transcriptional regulator